MFSFQHIWQVQSPSCDVDTKETQISYPCERARAREKSTEKKRKEGQRLCFTNRVKIAARAHQQRIYSTGSGASESAMTQTEMSVSDWTVV